MKLLRVENLDFSYNNHKALENVTFDVEEGDFIGIIGENGSGKSTLIKLILGLLPLKTGKISFLGENNSSQNTPSFVGYVPQNLSISASIFPISVWETVMLGLRNKVLKKKEKREKIEDALDKFGIKDLKNKLISELSGGQLQKVFLAKAIISEPKLLILDEPSSALDSQTRKEFYQSLINLNEEKKTTIIIITHDTATVGKYVNKLLYLDKKLIFYGKLKEFCLAGDMAEKIGLDAQHLICHQHHKNNIIT